MCAENDLRKLRFSVIFSRFMDVDHFLTRTRISVTNGAFLVTNFTCDRCGTQLELLYLIKDPIIFSLTKDLSLTTDIEEGDTRPCAIFILTWGSIWGSSSFSCNKNNHASLIRSINCMHFGLSMKTITH